jgi:uncharacterized protein YcfJ
MEQIAMAGIFENEERAAAAKEHLQASGYREVTIEPLREIPEHLQTTDSDSNSTSMKGTYAGAAIGIGVGEIAGMAAGAMLGPMAAMGGAAAGAVAGGLAGALIGTAATDSDAASYRKYQAHGARLTVWCGEASRDDLTAILKAEGAISVSVTATGRTETSLAEAARP